MSFAGKATVAAKKCTNRGHSSLPEVKRWVIRENLSGQEAFEKKASLNPLCTVTAISK
jgi:hypothetical protein